jgi:hypothetical protein
MQQEINLFKFVKLPIKSVLDAEVFGILFGGFFGFLMLVFLITLFHQARLSSTAEVAKNNLEAKRRELVALAGRYPESGIPSQILDSTRLPMCNTKFSSFLESFSQAVIPGIWLTEITIAQSGHEISLKGHALRALEVQQFLLQLKQQSLFANLAFDILQLNDQPPPISFEVVGRAVPHA